MPSFTTLYRALLMLAAAVIIVKGWQLYGPSSAQMKAAALRAVELAHSALNESEPRAEAIAEVTVSSHQTVPATSANQPGIASQSSADSTPDTALAAPPIFTVPTPVAASAEAAATAVNAKLSASAAADRLPALLSRLEELGGIDPQLVAWGSSGQLYRFCCRAALAGAPNYTRHFEAVAPEPLVAVENVVAKVEAWRTAERAPGRQR